MIVLIEDTELHRLTRRYCWVNRDRASAAAMVVSSEISVGGRLMPRFKSALAPFPAQGYLRHDAGIVPLNGSLICIVSVRPDRGDGILSVRVHHHCQE
ncbi:MAG: hypothetical protein WBF73_26860 [Bradyrhizobium sp.]